MAPAPGWQLSSCPPPRPPSLPVSRALPPAGQRASLSFCKRLRTRRFAGAHGAAGRRTGGVCWGGGAASPEPSGRTALGPHSGRPPAARRTPAPLPGPTTALAGQASACMLYILADRCHPVHAASQLHAFTLRAALASAWRGPPMCMMYMDCGCGLKTMPGPGSARMGGAATDAGSAARHTQASPIRLAPGRRGHAAPNLPALPLTCQRCP